MGERCISKYVLSALHCERALISCQTIFYNKRYSENNVEIEPNKIDRNIDILYDFTILITSDELDARKQSYSQLLMEGGRLYKRMNDSNMPIVQSQACFSK